MVMMLEKVPPALRGELTRWLIEIKPGVYIGHVNGLVRDRLWEKCSGGCKAGSVFQAWSTNTEQKYKMRLYGASDREIVDWEGLQLIREIDPGLLTTPQKQRTRRND